MIIPLSMLRLALIAALAGRTIAIGGVHAQALRYSKQPSKTEEKDDIFAFASVDVQRKTSQLETAAAQPERDMLPKEAAAASLQLRHASRPKNGLPLNRGTPHVQFDAFGDGLRLSLSKSDKALRQLAAEGPGCGQGSYLRESACEACPPGQYQPSNGFTGGACTRCERGYFQELDRMATCDLCPMGTYTLEPAGAVNRERCISTTGSCGNGQFFSGEGTCTLCEVGHYLDAPELPHEHTECLPCAEGKYQDDEGRATCKPCDPGLTSPAKATSRAACVAGEGGITCDNGRYLVASKCEPCAAGKYTFVEGGGHTLDRCTDCSTGRISGPQAIECDACSLGSTSNAGHTSCVVCPKGHYGQNAANPSCPPCPAGKYQDTDGQATCKNCPAGRTSPGAADNVGQCVPSSCGLGHHVAAGGGCSACAAGKYISETTHSLTVCTNCAAGLYASSTKASTCATCELGQTSVAGSPSCFSCPVGQKGVNPAAPTCEDCTPGRYQDGDNSVECKSCPSGRWSNAKDTSCDLTGCAAGLYLEEGRCLECAPGYFRPEAGHTYGFCEPCESGRYAAGDGAAGCEPCAGGLSSPNGAAECSIKCERGHYLESAESCAQCPEGLMQSSPASFATACSACAAGHYATDERDGCAECAAGKYAAGTGASEDICQGCEAGYTSSDGASSCTQCGAGRYESSHTSCPACAAGRFASAASTSCTSCPTGRYASTSGGSLTICELCPEGKGNASPGSTTCDVCASGRYGAGGGQLPAVPSRTVPRGNWARIVQQLFPGGLFLSWIFQLHVVPSWSVWL